MRGFSRTRNTPRTLHTPIEAKLSGISKFFKVPALAFFKTHATQMIIAILLA
jgi:hypothetical protein